MTGSSAVHHVAGVLANWEAIAGVTLAGRGDSNLNPLALMNPTHPRHGLKPGPARVTAAILWLACLPAVASAATWIVTPSGAWCPVGVPAGAGSHCRGQAPAAAPVEITVTTSSQSHGELLAGFC